MHSVWFMYIYWKVQLNDLVVAHIDGSWSHDAATKSEWEGAFMIRMHIQNDQTER